MKNYLFIRGLRRVDHTVFSVADGQKTYREPQFNLRELPFSSGQQVKRSILDAMVQELGIGRAPVEFQYKLDPKDPKKKAPVEDIALQQLDPRNPDELLGGWMRASGKGAEVKDGDFGGVIKRRSPLSISALRALHPLLAGVDREEAISFDRTDDGNSSVKLLDKDGKVMPHDEMVEYLHENSYFLRKSKYVDARNQKRVYGLFVNDIAIDLRRLFAVSVDETQPEIDPKYLSALREEGWKDIRTEFGPCLLAPKEMRDKVIPAIAEAMVNWYITSNQARTYSPMEILAIAISEKANRVNAAIRSRLEQDRNGRDKATPVLETKLCSLHVYLPAESYIHGAQGKATALEDAQAEIEEKLRAYDYEGQN